MTPPDRRHPEQDLRAVLDNMTDVFYRTDGSGRVVLVSRSVETLLGWRQDEVLGRDDTSFYVDPEQRQRVVELITAQGGRITGHDIQLRHRNGRPVWVSLSARALPEEDGGGSEGVLHDVSDRRRAEGEQVRRHALVQALLNATSDATMLIDASGRLLACNQVFAERFGHSVEDVCGRDLFSLFPPDVADRRRTACDQVAREGRTMVLRDVRGGRHLMNTITPVPNPDGTPWLAVFSRDITEEVEDKARIEAHMATIRRSNEELEQFAYVASHDLREPLRQISSYIGLLERRYLNLLDDDGREFMAYVRNGAQRMDSLILDLLAFSRVTRVDADLVPLPVAQPIAAALEVLTLGDDATIELAVDPALMVRGDPGQLARMFQNLIGNALKYRAADRPPRVQVRAERQGNMIAVSVTDNGIGIDPQYFDRIFRIFQRLHGASKYQGTGIGLAIVKRVADNHGGTVTVSSTPGQGSTFTVTLRPAD